MDTQKLPFAEEEIDNLRKSLGIEDSESLREAIANLHEFIAILKQWDERRSGNSPAS